MQPETPFPRKSLVNFTNETLPRVHLDENWNLKSGCSRNEKEDQLPSSSPYAGLRFRGGKEEARRKGRRKTKVLQ